MINSIDRIITNHLLIDELDYWDEFTTKKLSPEETSYYRKITETLDKQLQEYVEWLQTDEAKRYYYDETTYRREAFQELDPNVDEILRLDQEDYDRVMEDFYNNGVQEGHKQLHKPVTLTESDKLALGFVKDYNYDLVRNLSMDMCDNVKHMIWEGIGAGESIPVISQRIRDAGLKSLPGSTLNPYQRATMIARTETARAYTSGSLQSYSKYGVKSIEVVCANDSAVCSICLTNAYEFNSKSEVVLENHGAVKVHGIGDAKGLVPAHPNCRCSVAPRILDYDKLPDTPLNNPDVINLTPLKNRNSKSYDNLKTPEDVAEYYGLKYEPTYANKKKTKLNEIDLFDEKYGVKIHIPNYYINGKGSKYIDFNNKGSKFYDFKEVIQIYDNAPSISKYATNNINFLSRNSGTELASAQCWTKDVTNSKIISIRPKTFENSKSSRGNFAQSLYHEMGHCLDYSFIEKNKANIVNKLINQGGIYKADKRLVQEYRQNIRQEDLFSISYNNDFKNAVNKDTQYQRNNDFPVEKSSWYGKRGGIKEDWAETVSMASFSKLNNKNMAVMQNYNYKSVNFDEWTKLHPNKYQFAVDKLNNLKVKDMTLK